MKKKTTVTVKKKKKSNPALFVICLVICGGLVFAFFNFHFILKEKEFVICPKTELTWEDTFVDVRKWGPLDYLQHPRVAMALLQRKKALSRDRFKEMQKEFKKDVKKFEGNLQKELDKLLDN